MFLWNRFLICAVLLDGLLGVYDASKRPGKWEAKVLENRQDRAQGENAKVDKDKDMQTRTLLVRLIFPLLGRGRQVLE